MPDFDVAAVGLSVPPPLASLTTYRPSITVRNNGIHPALATGSVRIYKSGALIFESAVYSGTIQPGYTGLAQAEKYWTPDTVGTYNVQGYVTCPSDQVEPNNNLAPVTIVVGTTPPPPPPIVTAHASQHEEGGEDQLSVDGLAGKLLEAQDPYDHASNHSDGGTDEIDVSGLSGQLADEQKPAIHANEAHSPSFATSPQVADLINIHNQSLTAHDAAIGHGIDVHNADTAAHVETLQTRAEKDVAEGYAGLDETGWLSDTSLAGHNQDNDAHPRRSLLVGINDKTARTYTYPHWPSISQEIPTESLKPGEVWQQTIVGVIEPTMSWVNPRVAALGWTDDGGTLVDYVMTGTAGPYEGLWFIVKNRLIVLAVTVGTSVDYILSTELVASWVYGSALANTARISAVCGSELLTAATENPITLYAEITAQDRCRIRYCAAYTQRLGQLATVDTTP